MMVVGNTANRTAEVHAGTYTVKSTATGLRYKAAAGIGTEIDADADFNAVSVTANNYLTDASFDHTGKLIFEPNSFGTAAKSLSGVALASATEDNMKRQTIVDDNGTPEVPGDDVTSYVYSVFTWDITFYMDFNQSSPNMGLFLDGANSSFTKPAAAGGTTYETGNGFRMAIVGQTASVTETKVYAGLCETDNCRYINSTALTTASAAPATYAAYWAGNWNATPNPEKPGSAYTSAYTAEPLAYPDLVSSTSATHALPADGVATAVAKQSNGYLGKFTFSANSTVAISFKVVCWFEGTDKDVQTDENTAYESVTAELAFTTVQLSD